MFRAEEDGGLNVSAWVEKWMEWAGLNLGCRSLSELRELLSWICLLHLL